MVDHHGLSKQANRVRGMSSCLSLHKIKEKNQCPGYQSLKMRTKRQKVFIVRLFGSGTTGSNPECGKCMGS